MARLISLSYHPTHLLLIFSYHSNHPPHICSLRELDIFEPLSYSFNRLLRHLHILPDNHLRLGIELLKKVLVLPAVSHPLAIGQLAAQPVLVLVAF
jgi:hypothetical protein